MPQERVNSLWLRASPANDSASNASRNTTGLLQPIHGVSGDYFAT
jgi:hypothetical protein